MADETKNYGFPKPGEGDFYDIGIFNLAMDRADEAIKEAEEKTGRHCMDKGIHITEEEREKWDSSLLSTGDSKDNTVTFNSGDAINPTGWADVGLVESGEEHKSLWRKVSLFAKNMRYLWKLYGAHDISKLGDGTLTGAISKLNTDLGSKIGLTGIFLTESRNDYIDCDMVPIGGCAYTYTETIHAPTAEGGWRVFCFGTNEYYKAQFGICHGKRKIAFRSSYNVNDMAVWEGWTVIQKT